MRDDDLGGQGGGHGGGVAGRGQLLMLHRLDPELVLVDVDDVLVGGVGLRERIKLVHLLDVPGEEDEDDGKGNEDDIDDVSNLQRAVNSAGIS